MLSPSLRAIALRIWLTGTSVKLSLATICGKAIGAAALAEEVLVAGVKFSTSRFTMRPLSPLPGTKLMSIPISLAKDLAKGEALRRESVTVCDTGSATVGVGAAGAVLLGATGAVSVAAAGVAAGLAASKALMSSPALPTMAIRASTGTEPPAGIPICKRVPLTKFSSSMVALSVSTSARISPGLIASPTFFNHDTITPSVMVSLILGILITSAISFCVFLRVAKIFFIDYVTSFKSRSIGKLRKSANGCLN